MGVITAAGVAAAAGAVTAGAAVAGAVGDRNAAKAAQKNSYKERDESLAYIREQVAKTQGQLFNIFPQIQQNNQAAMLAGIDFYKQAFPQQLSSFNQGNMNAQRTLAGGLQPMNAAILGGTMDLSQIQPQQAQINPQAMNSLYNPQPIPFMPITQV